MRQNELTYATSELLETFVAGAVNEWRFTQRGYTSGDTGLVRTHSAAYGVYARMAKKFCAVELFAFNAMVQGRL